MTNPTKPHSTDTERAEYGLFFFTFFIGLTILTGWRLSHYHLISPGHGLGYSLGITGGILFLMLLLYPLQKRIQSRSRTISMKNWFRLHMLCGVISPVLILFHCNYHMGDTNSNVALITMLVVASSGIFGRYFYSRIHRGLYGEKESVSELQARLKAGNSDLAILLKDYPNVLKEASDFVSTYSESGHTVSSSIIQALRARGRVNNTQRKIAELTKMAVKQRAQSEGWPSSQTNNTVSAINRKVRQELSTVLRIAQFNLFERLFALWHVLHIPLFFILLTAIIVHIATAHMY